MGLDEPTVISKPNDEDYYDDIVSDFQRMTALYRELNTDRILGGSLDKIETYLDRIRSIR